MSATLYLVVEDEDGTHLREWGLNNYDEFADADFDAAMLVDAWLDLTGIEAWEVE